MDKTLFEKYINEMRAMKASAMPEPSRPVAVVYHGNDKDMTGSGTLTIYYMSPYYRQMVEKYKDTGKETYFEMTLKNKDPESTVGANVQTLHDVSVDSVTLAKFDMEGEVLDEEVPFTFDDYTGLAQFAEEPQH